MKKEVLGVNQTKAEFVKSIHGWLMRTLKSLDREEYQKCFKIEGSSIMCELPDNFFDNYEIIEEKYNNNELPIPLKSFFGNITKRNIF